METQQNANGHVTILFLISTRKIVRRCILLYNIY